MPSELFADKSFARDHSVDGVSVDHAEMLHREFDADHLVGAAVPEILVSRQPSPDVFGLVAHSNLACRPGFAPLRLLR